MARPVALDELQALDDDDIPVAVFKLLVEGTRARGRTDRRGRATLVEAVHFHLGISFDALGRPLRDRLIDGFQALCERGFVWFNPHAEGSSGGSYEFTKRGRTATEDDVRSAWPSRGAVALERFPEHANWDETMGAYFRMAVSTHHARVSEAALFLIGGAAERLISVVEERVAHLLGPGWERRKVGERLTALVALFAKADDLATAELLEILGNVARWSRNDVGHPRPEPPDVSAAMVAARITEFPGYVSRVLQAADALANR